MEEKKDPIVSTVSVPPPEANGVPHSPQSSSRLRSWCFAIDTFADRTICKYFVIAWVILVLVLTFPDGFCRTGCCLKLSYVVQGTLVLFLMVVSSARGYLRMLLEEEKEASTAESV